MRTFFFLCLVVFCSTGGEICISHTMKQVGEVKSFAPRMFLPLLWRAVRTPSMWLGVTLLACAFYSLLSLLSWNPVSFVIPATASSYAVSAIGARFLLGERISAMRWTGVLLVCFGVALAWAGG